MRLISDGSSYGTSSFVSEVDIEDLKDNYFLI